jgi:Transglycosylase SLT domain
VGNLRLAGCVVAWGALLAALVTAAPACAAVWGYIDEQGRPHLATEQLDERYQLFFRGPTTAERAAAAKPPVSAADEAFVQTPIFKRLENHPNVKRYEPLIARFAKQYNLDAALVKAVVAVESAFEPLAVSPKGAIGLMQVIPDTGARYGLADDGKKSIAQKLLDPTSCSRTTCRLRWPRTTPARRRSRATTIACHRFRRRRNSSAWSRSSTRCTSRRRRRRRSRSASPFRGAESRSLSPPSRGSG